MSKFFISFLLLILIASFAFGQESQNTAKLNLMVTDKSDNPVGDLGKDEISLSIDGKPQAIISLEKQEAPLIYALAVDTSASMKASFRDVQHAVKSIISQNRANDELALIGFVSNDYIFTAAEFSSDKTLLTRKTGDFEIRGGQSAIIDALYLAVKKVAEYKKDDKTRPRAVVVITDGEDRDSYYSESALFELIKNEKVPVFFIGLVYGLDDSTPFNTRSRRATAINFIKKVAGKSGGAAIFPGNLPEAASRILSLLQTQYVVGYAPSAEGKSKTSEIEIKLAKDSKRKDVKFYVR